MVSTPLTSVASISVVVLTLLFWYVFIYQNWMHISQFRVLRPHQFFFSYFTETVENDKYVHYSFSVENVSFTSVSAPSSKSTPTLWSELKFKAGNHKRLETFPVQNTRRDWSMLRCRSFVGSTTSCCCSSQHWGLLCMFDVWWRCSSCTWAPGVQREKSIGKAAWQMHTSFWELKNKNWLFTTTESREARDSFLET